MTAYGTVLFVMYMTLIGVGLAIWTFRSPKGGTEK